MQIKLALLGLLIVLGHNIGSQVRAESEVYNGGTCVPYPPTTSNAVAYAHWLYGFRQSAHCHMAMASDRRVTDLRYAIFVGSASSGAMKARLCVFTANGLSYSCGAEGQITPSGIGVAVLYPPSPLPSYAQGAFIRVSFPADAVSTVQNYVPVWIPPLALQADLSVGAAKTTAALSTTGRPLGELLDPEILSVLDASGALDPAPAGAAQALPDQQTARVNFKASVGAKASATLQSLDCGNAECEAVVGLGDVGARVWVEREAAVEAWLAETSPCGYSLSVPQIGSPQGQMRARIDCR